MPRGLAAVAASATAALLVMLAIVVLNPDAYRELRGSDPTVTATAPPLVATSVATRSPTVVVPSPTATRVATSIATPEPTVTRTPTPVPTATQPPLPECLITGQLRDTDSGGPIGGVIISLVGYDGTIDGNDPTIVERAGKTNDAGEFVASCDEVPADSFPVSLALSHVDWFARWRTHILVDAGGLLGVELETSLCESLVPSGAPVATNLRVGSGPTRMLTLELRGNTPSYDFRTHTAHAIPSFGDFGFSHCHEATFYSNNGRPPFFQKGVVDLGDLGDTPLETIVPPVSGYERLGVPAVVGHTFVSPTLIEASNHIIFRLLEVETDGLQITKYVLEYYYREGD